ncbi:hypothetical protein M758_7G171600 [Ceratodon purpureus]|uniref:Uncharacterized protein n=1 Tax=Ceratodon purpureus TaxID=3225 RepID=A0A8T0H9L1_CERPU|nr:hypothetical protein KC19_7G174300 [Ceratodon purpureus]KAG0611867.1 hypothetical protein M758_7G171600 [Ceratodon purpureus]
MEGKNSGVYICVQAEHTKKLEAPSLTTSFGLGGATRRKICRQNCSRERHKLGCGRHLRQQSLSHNEPLQIQEFVNPRQTCSKENHAALKTRTANSTKHVNITSTRND